MLENNVKYKKRYTLLQESYQSRLKHLASALGHGFLKKSTSDAVLQVLQKDSSGFPYLCQRVEELLCESVQEEKEQYIQVITHQLVQCQEENEELTLSLLEQQKQRQSFQEQLTEFQEKYQRNYSLEVDRLKSQMEKMQRKWEQRWQAREDEMVEKYDAYGEEMEAYMNEQQDSFEKLMKEKDEEVNSHSQKHGMSALQSELEQQQRVYEQDIAKWMKVVQDKSKELEESEMEFKHQMEQLQGVYQEQMNHQEKSYQEQMEQVQSNYQCQLDELKIVYEKRLQVQAEKENIQEKVCEDVPVIEKEDSAKDGLEEKLHESFASLMLRQKEIEQLSKSVLHEQEQVSILQQKIGNITLENEQHVFELEKKFQMQRKEDIDEQELKFENRKRDWEKHQAQKKRVMEKEHAEKLKELQIANEAETKKRDGEYQTVLIKVRHGIKKLEQDCSELRKQKTDLEDNMQQSKNKSDAMRMQLVAQLKEANELIDELKQMMEQQAIEAQQRAFQEKSDYVKQQKLEADKHIEHCKHQIQQEVRTTLEREYKIENEKYIQNNQKLATQLESCKVEWQRDEKALKSKLAELEEAHDIQVKRLSSLTNVGTNTNQVYFKSDDPNLVEANATLIAKCNSTIQNVRSDWIATRKTLAAELTECQFDTDSIQKKLIHGIQTHQEHWLHEHQKFGTSHKAEILELRQELKVIKEQQADTFSQLKLSEENLGKTRNLAEECMQFYSQVILLPMHEEVFSVELSSLNRSLGICVKEFSAHWKQKFALSKDELNMSCSIEILVDSFKHALMEKGSFIMNNKVIPLQTELQLIQEAMTLSEDEKTKSIQELSMQIAECNKNWEDTKQELAAAETSLQNSIRQMEKDRETLVKKHEKKLEHASDEYKREIGCLQEKHAKQFSESDKKWEQEKDIVIQDKNNRIAKLERSVNLADIKVAELEREIIQKVSFAENFESVQTHMDNELKAILAEKVEQIDALNDQLVHANAEIKQWKDRVDATNLLTVDSNDKSERSRSMEEQQKLETASCNDASKNEKFRTSTDQHASQKEKKQQSLRRTENRSPKRNHSRRRSPRRSFDESSIDELSFHSFTSDDSRAYREDDGDHNYRSSRRHLDRRRIRNRQFTHSFHDRQNDRHPNEDTIEFVPKIFEASAFAFDNYSSSDDAEVSAPSIARVDFSELSTMMKQSLQDLTMNNHRTISQLDATAENLDQRVRRQSELFQEQLNRRKHMLEPKAFSLSRQSVTSPTRIPIYNPVPTARRRIANRNLTAKHEIQNKFSDSIREHEGKLRMDHLK